MQNSVTFVCGKEEAPLQIQLEPEALLFSVLPGSEITFVGKSSTGTVKWAVQFYQADNLLQLWPEGMYDVTIYENGELLTDWWKYM